MLRSLKEYVEDILIFGGGGSLMDPPWVPLKSTNARVLCSYGGYPPPPDPGEYRLEYDIGGEFLERGGEKNFFFKL